MPRKHKKDRNGQIMRCKFCESEYHLQKDCWAWRELDKEVPQMETKGNLMENEESIEKEMNTIEKARKIE